jgi:putative oxidoreductase
MVLQRLYSTFPSGLPGLGLFCLRLAAGGFLMAGLPALAQPWLFALLLCTGACVCIGLWTPITAGCDAAGEVFLAVSRPIEIRLHVLLAIVALSLAMLGPGAWSLDSLIFGRKRIRL